ncbi:hypothetical protein ECG_09558 [Echinococcus granulosus]|nr:hypothetical protein ECG_09558 [Echinococcus granulosus]
MPLLVSLRQYLCLIIILYVTSIRGFRLDPEALLKTGYSHGTLLAIGASLGLLAVVTFVSISCCIKKDSSVKATNYGANQQIISGSNQPTGQKCVRLSQPKSNPPPPYKPTPPTAPQ